MKNIIKIAASALIVFLTLGTVAFAEPSTNGGSTGSTNSTPSTNGGSAGSVNSVPSTNGGSVGSVNSTPSTNGGSVGSTNGTAPSTPTDSESNGSSNSRNRSGGGSYRKTVSLTNVQVKVVGNTATVTWDTTPAAQGMLVYGPLSLVTPTTATSFYGYAAGTAVTGATIKHSHTFTMASGMTYYVRPVAIVGARAVYGSELKVGRIGTVVKTAAPAVGTIFDAPAKTVIDSKIPADVEVSKGTSTNVANIKDATPSKVGSFFKKIWNTIIAPFCN
jgi:hypothetical protein